MKKLLLVPFLTLLFVGCQTTGVVSSDPVVNAEKLTASAEATFNTLFVLEKQNHDLVVKYAPQVHKLVDGLRLRAIPLLESARAVTKTYEASSTPQNRASLDAILKTLSAAIDEALSYKSQLVGLKGP